MREEINAIHHMLLVIEDSKRSKHRRETEAKDRVFCWDWDDKNMNAWAVTDSTGKVLGMLQPVDYEMVARSQGIQEWSKPC